MHPLANVVEGVSVGHIIDYDDAVSAAIVAGGQSSEAFLTSSVPLFKV